MSYLQTKTMPSDFTKNQKDSLRRKCKNFMLKEGLLYYRDELCKLSGIKCNITSAYHPQSNGLDERFNQTLQRQLLKFVDSEPEQWDLYLDAILFSYRVSQQESTKYSPFFLVHGRQATSRI